MDMNKKNFTLVELLVVIAIIGVLAALIFPAIQGAINKAEDAKAKAGITTLVNAIKQYESTYGKLPTPKIGTNTKQCCGQGINETYYNALIRILQNEDFSSDDDTDDFGTMRTYNKRSIKFLDVQGNEPGKYLDPWDKNYIVLLDLDYDGKITPATEELNGVAVSPVNYSVIVWSLGNDNDYDKKAKNSKNKDNIYSFVTNWSKNDGHVISK